ncbi:CCAAT/enhancer-binding protein beta-like isoform X1 [Xyrauchen texanus]|uniref:CCAAT/enhancer-binding protein beta-like isoform X1 n=1 Tax=Xyrauchen texanus TaxID=154827 RepID=UPI002241F372|nr:CCAAT/enhancer-binding protein beta-like isoform X1 [Xyrauchen texanus]XP_051971289.1 CCAAT/enhancer-binding protein beta-like isoform X1 [Xyrauchen texanus]
MSNGALSSICMFTPQNPSSLSPDGTLPVISDSSGLALDQMPQMDGGPYGQSTGPRGCPKTQDSRSMEQMMGFTYPPYSTCLTPSNTDRASQQNQQDYSQFLLPPPASTLWLPGQKRGPSKDSIDYRLRRERNNIAVRKSRDKARRCVQLTQQRVLQLQDENHRLQLHIQRLSHDVDALRHYLPQRHLQVKQQDIAGENNC